MNKSKPNSKSKKFLKSLSTIALSLTLSLALTFTFITPTLASEQNINGELSNTINQTISSDQTYTEWDTKKDVSIDKIWSIKLNAPILESTVNNTNIYVLDNNGNRKDVKVNLSDTKTIKVTPVDNYKSGETYTLYILKDVSSATKKIALKSNIKMNFTIVEELETIIPNYTLTVESSPIDEYVLVAVILDTTTPDQYKVVVDGTELKLATAKDRFFKLIKTNKSQEELKTLTVITIKEESELAIDYIEDIEKTLNIGDSYSLPLTIEAIMIDGSKQQVNVIWDTTTVDTSKSGIQTIYGEVKDDNTVVCNITVRAKDELYEEAVITKILRNSSKNITSISAYVNGELKTYDVDSVTSNIANGDVAVFEINDNKVTDIITSGTEYTGRVKTDLIVKSVNASTKEVMFTNGITYQLASNGIVIDATDSNDITLESLSDLRDMNSKENVTVVLDGKTGTSAKFFVIKTISSGDINAGTRDNPIKGYNDLKIPFQQYSFDTAKTINLSVISYITSDPANRIVNEMNSFNKKPTSTQEWRLYRFDLTYVSGSEDDVLQASDVISESKFFLQNGSSLPIYATATLGLNSKPFSIYDVELYPNGSSNVVFGILVDKTAGTPIIKVPYNSGKSVNWIWCIFDGM